MTISRPTHSPAAGPRSAAALARAAFLCAALACGTLAAGALPALAGEDGQDASNPVLAIVNGAEVRATDLSDEFRNLPAEARQVPQELLYDMVLDNVISAFLVAQAAERAGLEQSTAYQRQMAVRRRSVLTQLYLQEVAREALDGEATTAAYEALKAEYEGREEVRARHILVADEAEAVRIIAELDAGLDFAEAARVHSTGPSAERGGDLGFFGEEAMVPEFGTVAFALEPGTYTAEPVQTQFGWHVIKVEARRPAEAPPMEQVRDELRQQIVEQAIAGEVERLREAASIEKTPPPAPEPPAGD